MTKPITNPISDWTYCTPRPWVVDFTPTCAGVGMASGMEVYEWKGDTATSFLVIACSSGEARIMAHERRSLAALEGGAQ